MLFVVLKINTTSNPFLFFLFFIFYFFLQWYQTALDSIRIKLFKQEPTKQNEKRSENIFHVIFYNNELKWIDTWDIMDIMEKQNHNLFLLENIRPNKSFKDSWKDLHDRYVNTPDDVRPMVIWYLFAKSFRHSLCLANLK